MNQRVPESRRLAAVDFSSAHDHGFNRVTTDDVGILLRQVFRPTVLLGALSGINILTGIVSSPPME